MSKAIRNRKFFSTNESIFDTLERYRDFCRDYGYKFDENNLNNMRIYATQQFDKFVRGKAVKNQWEEDLRKFEGNN